MCCDSKGAKREKIVHLNLCVCMCLGMWVCVDVCVTVFSELWVLTHCTGRAKEEEKKTIIKPKCSRILSSFYCLPPFFAHSDIVSVCGMEYGAFYIAFNKNLSAYLLCFLFVCLCSCCCCCRFWFDWNWLVDIRMNRIGDWGLKEHKWMKGQMDGGHGIELIAISFRFFQ